MKHIFLTGEIQVGKSTAIRAFLAKSRLSADGFLTHIVRSDGNGALHLARFDTERGETDDVVAARFVDLTVGFEIFGEVFNTQGAEFVETSGQRDLIIMDELGTMEADSPLFISAVLAKLDGTAPILGVLKKREHQFLDAVKNHRNVEVIMVDEHNRDEIPTLLTERFADLIGKGVRAK
jgi:nucleoside-triphosphatase